MIDDDIGWCRCGAAWFELQQYDDLDVDPEIGPAMCIDPEGSVTGYAGKLVCIECGEDWTPAQQPAVLQVLEGGREG